MRVTQACGPISPSVVTVVCPTAAPAQTSAATPATASVAVGGRVPDAAVVVAHVPLHGCQVEDGDEPAVRLAQRADLLGEEREKFGDYLPSKKGAASAGPGGRRIFWRESSL